MTQPRLKLRWDRTYPDKPKDYAAFDGEKAVGRVYFNGTGTRGMETWAWFGHGGPGIEGFGNGSADTKFEACEALERAYLERRQVNG